MNTNTALVNETEDLPGDFAIWIFILAEMLVFGVMFIVYAFARSNQLDVFNASQLTLSRSLGTLNTIILITSSYFVVRAVSAIKSGKDINTLDDWIKAERMYAALCDGKTFPFKTATQER